MDTAPTESTSSFDDDGNGWRAQKRIAESYTESNQDGCKIPSTEIECNQIKRFCTKASAVDKPVCSFRDSCSEPLVNESITVPVAKLVNLARNENIESTVLSPISEIALNMSTTSLSSNKSGGEANVDDGTPLRRYSKSHHTGPHKFNQLTQLLQEDIESDIKGTASTTAASTAKVTTSTIVTSTTIATSTTTAINNDHDLKEVQQQADKLDDEESNNSDSGLQLPRTAASTSLRDESRRLTRTAMSSINDSMAVDELSFYDDEETQQRSLTASPEFVGLLSPEGSPQHFQIVERAAVAAHPKFQPAERTMAPHQKPAQRSTLSSNISSAKSLHMFHSLSPGSMESTSMDDEYMELFEMESIDSQSQTHLNFPSDLKSLISGYIKQSSSACKGRRSTNGSASGSGTKVMKTPEMRRPSVRRCLCMSDNQQPTTPKTPEMAKAATEATTPFGANCFKRPEPPGSASCSPILNKRYRIEADKENVNASFSANAKAATSATPPAAINTATSVAPTRQVLRKSMSMNDAEILSALARSESTDQPDLIGDFSKPFALPLIDGRHRDLKSISSETVARLINGEFDDQVASYKIIDCRYPYEFDGGHIRGAVNLYTQEQIIAEFLTAQKTEQESARSAAAGSRRNIIIFHCEFSSERGPKLSRFLRNHDRARNTSLYPALDYPEVYLLHNGYKEFYETHAELCEPLAYRPMLEPAFSEAYRHFRSKSKSWNGDAFGGSSTRMKKSRSRLLL